MLPTQSLDIDSSPNSRRWGGPLSSGLFVLLFLSGRSASASWVFPGETSYALVEVSNGSATVDPNNWANVGGDNYNGASVLYISTGNYAVDFPAQWNNDLANGGNAQVTPVGSNGRCLIAGWGSGNATPGWTDANGNQAYDLIVDVQCFAPGGSPQDSSFNVSWVDRSSVYELNGVTQEGAYVWVFDPTTSSYDADGFYSWNSTGQPITVTHTAGSGIYQLLLGGQFGAFGWVTPDGCSPVPTFNGGTVEVSAYSWGGNDYCNPVGWDYNSQGLVISVACWNGSTGAADDSQFDLNFDTMSPAGLNSAAFAWANSPSTSSYSPAAGYQIDLTYEQEGNPCPHYVDTNGSTAVATITRSATGSYSVFFPDNYTGNSTVQSVAYGWSSNYCNNNGTSLWNGTGTELDVSCFATDGTPSDTFFVVNYGTTSFGIF